MDTFHQVSDGIVNAQNFADLSLSAVATDVTSKAKEIADLNIQIRTTELASGNANELRDRRDLLLQQLSKSAGISYAEQPDGMMDVKLLGGETLVSGSQYATLYTNAVGPSVTSNEIRITAIGAPPSAPTPATDANVTATIGGSNNSKGEIGGLLYMRDTSMPAYLAKLDELAYNLSYQVNTQHACRMEPQQCHRRCILLRLQPQLLHPRLRQPTPGTVPLSTWQLPTPMKLLLQIQIHCSAVSVIIKTPCRLQILQIHRRLFPVVSCLYNRQLLQLAGRQCRS